jgi:hypothetical protein
MEAQTIPRGKSIATPEDNSTQQDSMLKRRTKGRTRPIIFVAHSLGGIVVKKVGFCCTYQLNLSEYSLLSSQALILAHENDLHYGDILSSTIGVVFMGTPHRGVTIVDWTAFFRNAMQVMSGTQIVRADLIKELSTHSPSLLEISKQFLPRAADLKIMSFTELQIERPLTTLVSNPVVLLSLISFSLLRTEQILFLGCPCRICPTGFAKRDGLPSQHPSSQYLPLRFFIRPDVYPR